ncbi:RNA-binding protein 48 [Zostera marina]|uniref:RNA-binding protein 48 n=1 Tax=Zostera marina TaxID=29655 RepID=A0A0K9NRZ4_ZOSMR|nr:RNA-binding protein 48 [Zostera marina]
MPRNKEHLPAVCVYTVCDESRYLIVRNVPSFGCGEEISKLFGSYGPLEDCKPMDAEDCAPFTDTYWIKFQHINNARFAKRKLDDTVFLGNKIQVCYASQFEDLSDTKEKLEARRREVIARIKSGGVKVTMSHSNGPNSSHQESLQHDPVFPKEINSAERRNYITSANSSDTNILGHVSSNKDYFPSSSMNETVKVVRDKLDKISSTGLYPDAEPELKKKRTDNRRRI